jgi:hypothetical protein
MLISFSAIRAAPTPQAGAALAFSGFVKNVN